MGPSSPGAARALALTSKTSFFRTALRAELRRVSPLPLLAIPIGRQRARVYAVFALNHDDFYDLDPLTSSPSPIRLLYGDNSSLSYIVAAEFRPVTAFRIAHLSYRTRGEIFFPLKSDQHDQDAF